MTNANGCIVVYGGEDAKYDPVYARATDLARKRKATLVLYDAEAGSRFGSPQPTFWSGDRDLPDDHGRLSPERLDALGRERFANRVRAARSSGVDAWGWLPSTKGAQELADYASEQNAMLVVAPSDLDSKGLGDWIKGRPSLEEVDETVESPVIVVDVAEEIPDDPAPALT